MLRYNKFSSRPNNSHANSFGMNSQCANSFEMNSQRINSL